MPRRVIANSYVSSYTSKFLTAHNSVNSYVTTRYKGYSFEITHFVRRKEMLYSCVTSVCGGSAASLCEVRTSKYASIVIKGGTLGLRQYASIVINRLTRPSNGHTFPTTYILFAISGPSEVGTQLTHYVFSSKCHF